MNLSARFAGAAGAASVGVGILLLGQRFPGSVVAMLLLALGAGAAAQGVGMQGDALARAAAADALRRQTAFAPAWVLVTLAAAYRAGSPALADIAGAHGVAGVALARGPVLTVVGMWLGGLAVAVAIAGSGAARIPSLAPGEPAAPYGARRLEALATGLQVLFAAALLAGPQVRDPLDLVPWAVATAAIGVWAWYGRAPARLPAAPWGAGALAALGLLAVLAGGRP